MKEKEVKLLITLLNTASDEFSNHVCNDIPKEWLVDWSQDELNELDKKICEFNNSPDEHDSNKTSNYNIWDWILFGYFARLIEKENPTNKIIFEVTLENCPFTCDVECGITLEDDDYWDRRKCDFEKCPLRKMSLWDIVEMCRSDDY